MIGDLIAPGSERLRFENFDPVEIKTVSYISMDVNPHTIINEYGSNFVKYKLDLLVTIEAKNALHKNNKDEFFQFYTNTGKSGNSIVMPTIEEEQIEHDIVDRATSMSPIKGSQGAPEVDLSSQDEASQKETQDIDWDLIQEEDER